MGNIRRLLNEQARAATNLFDQGKRFEEVVKIYLSNDKIQSTLYEKVWSYGDWAIEHGRAATDIGIDLVASLRDGSGSFCAVQCKFYQEKKTIQKKDIDSFISASAGKKFSRRILFDTTEGNLGVHVQKTLEDLPNFQRLSIDDLDQSSIDWDQYFFDSTVQHDQAKKLRPHQERALTATLQRFQETDRGQLIMACGTGKTLTALRIAERHAGRGKRVLVLVPSLALMHQNILEWAKDAILPLKAYAVCSDRQAGRRSAGTFDVLSERHLSELVLPATTDAEQFSSVCIAQHSNEAITVVYSTYQSLQVLKDAQKKYQLPDFDLTICDEAHRTTGKLEGGKESHFVLIHENSHIRSSKRLYMTATPRIYAEQAKSKAKQHNIPICSMDDPVLFGKEFYRYGFRRAVEDRILSDYKVVVLVVDEFHVASNVSEQLRQDNDLKLDLASKLVGCWRALTKVDFSDEIDDKQPMRRALAFTNRIDTSKTVADTFAKIVTEYRTKFDESSSELDCEVEHIDGSFNAKRRTHRLDWLKEPSQENNCRILTNAKCLTEGVDVPALDAILFLEPRKSQLDVVQAVGRVMRRAEGKERGYVVLPVVVPFGVDPEKVLNDNKRFKVIWQILNALRTHDDGMDEAIHKAAIGEDVSPYIVIDTLGFKSEPSDDQPIPLEPPERSPRIQPFLFVTELKTQLVKRCGRLDFWEDWAKDIGDIAQAHVTRIRAIVNRPENTIERTAFDELLAELRDDLNPQVSEEAAIEMLAQHLVTGPVFNSLFQGNQFTQENSVSRGLESVIRKLQIHRLDKEAGTLDKFYKSVKRRASGISTVKGRQSLITELYETFFRKAFRRTTDLMGIVYTPVEVVDFILHSVNDVLNNEFGRSISDENVHVLDPFVGTGTFLTRLLASDLIKEKDLKRKYQKELHANELVLLAYYIAGINIEAVYHERLNLKQYEAFGNLCLTDTFQMEESDSLLACIFPFNSKRLEKQKSLDIEVIIGNPPWSVGQRYANDNNPNLSYDGLDQRISDTYAHHSTAMAKNSLYGSYVRALRWSSDRIGERGVIGFVTNGGWLEGNAPDGIRHCLQEEFSSLYIFNLRGNTRTSGELARKEGGKVFGAGSRSTVVISILTKNYDAKEFGQIFYRDIGDYYTREEKLNLISKFKSINGIAKSSDGWTKIKPNQYKDWINQRNPDLDSYYLLGSKKKVDSRLPRVFSNYSLGFQTARDAWCYNASKDELTRNLKRSIDFFNCEVRRYRQAENKPVVRDFVHFDSTQFKWFDQDYPKVKKGEQKTYESAAICEVHYRPFTKVYGYFHRSYNARVSQLPKIFPCHETENRVICLQGIGVKKPFSTLMTDVLPDYGMVSMSQCFPLYLYESEGNLTDANQFLTRPPPICQKPHSSPIRHYY